MADAFTDLLNATIHHLGSLKAGGRRFVSVNPALLAALTKPAPAGRPREPRPPRRSTPVGRETADGTPGSAGLSAPPGGDEPGAGPAAAKERALADLKARALVCQRCPHLVRSRSQVVFGVGRASAELMFVGEAPGADEDAQGEPFVGRAGQLLTRIIETMGLRREAVYIANILKCRPDMPAGSTGNRKPTAEEMETCIPWLLEQIEIIQPKVLVGLGATAVEGLVGGKVSITRLRGQWREFKGIPLMPTFHPSYLIRGNDIGKKRLVWEDMLQVMEALKMPVTERQRGFFLKGR